MYEIRTDLALETQEKMKEDKKSLRGVRSYEEKISEDITISTVIIETENAAKAMGKPRGRYVTIEAGNMSEEDDGYHREISVQLAKMIRNMLPQFEEEEGEREDAKELSALVVGLGNREITPDALGPRVVDNLFITRHILKEFGKYAFGSQISNRISGLVPGVMAQTGMECQEIIRGVVRETKPDCIIAIDALAARNTRRLGRTIQLSDSGISPGSGIGNQRNALNQESIGIPVISLGVPTVVDAATIVSDAMSMLMKAMAESGIGNAMESSYGKLDESEKQELARELLSPQLHSMFVTPKDIDESIKRLSFTISEGLNIAFHGNKCRLKDI